MTHETQWTGIERMKTRRKFELLMKDLRRVIEDAEIEDRRFAMFSLTMDLRPLITSISEDAEKASQLIEVARMARESRGPGRAAAEEQLMGHLDSVVRVCCDRIADWKDRHYR
ncbi:MAG: hypothetical protein JXR37_30370 [Kiritimatiellae bacterium]|nr:hypothetical protein [Kiritimatiellia bacterium]